MEAEFEHTGLFCFVLAGREHGGLAMGSLDLSIILSFLEIPQRRRNCVFSAAFGDGMKRASNAWWVLFRVGCNIYVSDEGDTNDH